MSILSVTEIMPACNTVPGVTMPELEFRNIATGAQTTQQKGGRQVKSRYTLSAMVTVSTC